MSNNTRRRTYYDILGVPVGASIEHIKDSYRLLAKKTFITDIAYGILTDPKERRQYNSELVEGQQPAALVATQSTGDYQRVPSDTAESNRIRALTLLRTYDFHDRTIQVENAPSWSAFMQANGSGVERYFFSEDNQYLLLADFSPFVLAGEGWHTLNWWLFKSGLDAWELVRQGEFGDNSLELALALTSDPSEQRHREGKRKPRHEWIGWGAPSEMPVKPDITTHTELHYVAGIERMTRSGVTLSALSDTVLECTPEELRGDWGIVVETQGDIGVLVRYVQWLNEVGIWYKSLPNDLAAMVADGLETAEDGRYKFLVTQLR